MKFASVSRGNQSSMVYGMNGRGAMINGSSESLECRALESDADRGEIARLQRVAQPKVAYNSEIGMRNFWLGLGYFFYIVPGVGAKLYYDTQYDKAIEQSQAIERMPAGQ